MYIPVPASTDEPLYIRIYRAVRGDCLSGVLQPDDRLPSRRKLAGELGVSVNTVDGAYQQLVSEGYVESLPRSGFVVRPLFGEGAQSGELGFRALQKAVEPPGKIGFQALQKAVEPPGEIGFQTLQKAVDPPRELEFRISEEIEDFDPAIKPECPVRIDFSPNGVNLSALPIGDLRKLTREVFAMDPEIVFGPCEPEGHSALRRALCRYLASSRGILCSPDQLVVGAGTDYILQYLVRLLRLSGRIDGIATENPVYNKAFRIFESMGESVVPLPLDEQGLRTAALRDCRANVVYVTPSHQFPLGIVMPAGRRAELLSWAAASPERYVIEDDYDSEFRYSGRPVPPLFAMSKSDKVIYLGTFSKSIAPSMRVSYLVLPERLVEICRHEMAYFNTTVSVPDQLILARFIETGLFERHINRMRTLYRRKKDLLVKELAVFGDTLEISGTDAGLHLICMVRSGPDRKQISSTSEKIQSSTCEKTRKGHGENDLVAAAAELGVRVYGISEYFLERDASISRGDLESSCGDEAQRSGFSRGTDSDSSIRTGGSGTAVSDYRIPESTVLLGYGGLDSSALTRGCELLRKAWFT